MILITIHELGHFLTAIFFKFDIDKIYFYPYGGISKFNLQLNVLLYQELLVLVMGPIFQLLAFFLLLHINYFSHYTNLIYSINYSILLFNFLPIYPLDGGKLLNIIFNYKFNFQTSLKLIIIISYITVILIFIYFLNSSFTLNTIFMISFLLYKITEENKKRKYYYDKFLLERYLNNYKFKKRKQINSVSDFYRDKSHIIKGKDGYHTEKEILLKKFTRKC